MQPSCEGGQLLKDNFGLFISGAVDYTRMDKIASRPYPQKPYVSTDFSTIEPETFMKQYPTHDGSKGIFLVILLVALYFGFRS